MPLIDVARDLEGVRIAVEELLEESFRRYLLGSVVDRMADDDGVRMLGSLPARTLSPGYYKWAGYLLDLEELRECEIPIGDLQAIEIQGLVHLRRARHAFNVLHPCCSCGQRLESRWVPGCDGCGAKFTRES